MSQLSFPIHEYFTRIVATVAKFEEDIDAEKGLLNSMQNDAIVYLFYFNVQIEKKMMCLWFLEGMSDDYFFP